MNKKKTELKIQIENELHLEDVHVFRDERSLNFFFIKHLHGNSMVLIKDDYPADFLQLVQHFDDRYPMLPRFVKISQNFFLFNLPSGVLKRLTEEKLTDQLIEDMIALQHKLNEMMSSTPYNWEWKLNYFFLTSQGMMYIDFETIEEVPQSIFIPDSFSSLDVRQRVLLKIEKEKMKK